MLNMIIANPPLIICCCMLVILIWLKYWNTSKPILIHEILTSLDDVPTSHRHKVIQLLEQAILNKQFIKIPLEKIIHDTTILVIIMPAEYCDVEDDDGTFLDPSMILN